MERYRFVDNKILRDTQPVGRYIFALCSMGGTFDKRLCGSLVMITELLSVRLTILCRG